MVAGLVGYVVYRRRFLHVAAARDREGAAGARACSGARVPATCSSPCIAGPAVGRRDGRRVPARGRAARADRRAERARGPARPRADRSTSRSSRRPRNARARRGGRDRRLVRRPGAHAARASARRRAGDRRRGRRAKRRDHRPRRRRAVSSPRAQAAVFGKTVDYVLKHASCRVLVDGRGAGMKPYSVARGRLLGCCSSRSASRCSSARRRPAAASSATSSARCSSCSASRASRSSARGG